MTTKIAPLTVLPLAVVTACAATQRSPQMYRADTQKVLLTRNAQIKRCYDQLLATDPGAGGTVTVRFVVEKKTGAFARATLDPSTSNAKEPLVLCVLDALNGLKLDPPDANEGQATFSYQLEAPPAAPTPPT